MPANGGDATIPPGREDATIRPAAGTAEFFPAIGRLPDDAFVDRRYRVLEPAAIQGSEADVFKCKDVVTGQVVAVKLYRGEFKPDVEVLDRLVGIGHEGVVALNGYGSWNGRFYEVMEWCHGGSLDRYVPFEEKTLVETVIPQVAAALAFMASSNIIHGDLKHSNLMYRDVEKTRVVVSDFGISSIVRGSVSYRVTKAWYGTHVFSAPETYFGTMDKRSDYYSFGVIVMYLLTGQSPFGVMAPQEIMREKIWSAITPPRACSVRLKVLLEGLLARNAHDRWGADEVRGWLRGEDVPVRREDPRPEGGFHYRLDEGLEAGDLRALGRLLFDNYELGKEHLRHGILIRGIEHHDQGLAARLCAICDRAESLDAAYLEIVYTLNPSLPYRLTGR